MLLEKQTSYLVGRVHNRGEGAETLRLCSVVFRNCNYKFYGFSYQQLITLCKKQEISRYQNVCTSCMRHNSL